MSPPASYPKKGGGLLRGVLFLTLVIDVFKGKSTLLKILSRITEPTTGRIELNGRVASLLEVGSGRHHSGPTVELQLLRIAFKLSLR